MYRTFDEIVNAKIPTFVFWLREEFARSPHMASVSIRQIRRFNHGRGWGGLETALIGRLQDAGVVKVENEIVYFLPALRSFDPAQAIRGGVEVAKVGKPKRPTGRKARKARGGSR